MTKEERIEIIKGIEIVKNEMKSWYIGLCSNIHMSCEDGKINPLAKYFIDNKIKELNKTKKDKYHLNGEKSKQGVYLWKPKATLGRVRFLNKLIKELEDELDK